MLILLPFPWEPAETTIHNTYFDPKGKFLLWFVHWSDQALSFRAGTAKNLSLSDSKQTNIKYTSYDGGCVCTGDWFTSDGKLFASSDWHSTKFGMLVTLLKLGGHTFSQSSYLMSWKIAWKSKFLFFDPKVLSKYFFENLWTVLSL